MDPTQQAQQLASSIQAMIRQMAPLTASIGDLKQSIAEATTTTQQYTVDQTVLNKLSKDEQKTYNTLVTSLRSLNNDLKNLSREMVDGSTSEERRRDITIQMTELEQRRSKIADQLSGYTKKAGLQLGNFELKTGTAAKALAVLGNAAVIFTRGINDQIRSGSGTIVGYGSNFVEAAVRQQIAALKRGIPVNEFAETAAANRALVDAMGGTENMMTVIDGSMNKLWYMTTNIGESMKIAADMASDLAFAGIEPTTNAINAYYGRLSLLSRLTGMSASQSQQAISTMIKSESMQTLLLRARASERRAIVDSREAMLDNITAITGSTAAAQKMIDEVNHMVTAKPLDRLAQVAHLRAYAGALGIHLDPNALRGILSGHPDAQQAQAIAQMQMQLTRITNRNMGGSFATQLVTSQLLQGLHLDYLSAGVFQTTGQPVMKNSAAGLALQANAVDDAYKKNGKTVDWLTKKYLQSDKVLTQFGTTIGELTEGHTGATALVGIGGLLAAKPVGKIGKWAVNKAKGLFGKGSAVAEGEPPAPVIEKTSDLFGSGELASQAEAVGSTASRFAIGAKGGIVGMIGGAGLDIAGTYLKTHGHKELGQGISMTGTTVSDAATGAMIGSLLGPIGTAIGGVLGGAYGLYSGYQSNYGSNSGVLPNGPHRPSGPIAVPQRDEKKTLNDLTEISSAVIHQTKQMDANNSSLAQLAKTSQEQLEIAKAQIAMTMSNDKGKTAKKITSSLMNSSDFSAVYNYIH